VSLAETYADLSVPTRRCRIAAILDALDDTDRAWLTTALADPAHPSQTLANALRKANPEWATSGATVLKHRTGGCACGTR